MSSRKQTRFQGNQIHLPSHNLDVLTGKLGRMKQNSAERKTRNQATFTFYAQQKVAENWAPHCTNFGEPGTRYIGIYNVDYYKVTGNQNIWIAIRLA